VSKACTGNRLRLDYRLRPDRSNPIEAPLENFLPTQHQPFCCSSADQHFVINQKDRHVASEHRRDSWNFSLFLPCAMRDRQLDSENAANMGLTFYFHPTIVMFDNAVDH